MELIFTLKSIYSGATYVAGPFDISGTTSGGATTILLGDNISKASLSAGVMFSNVDDTITGGTVQSVDGTCSNSVPWSISQTTGCTINEYTLTSTGDGASWDIYTTCDDASLTTITLSGNDTTEICGRNPQLQSGTGTITLVGPCTEPTPTPTPTSEPEPVCKQLTVVQVFTNTNIQYTNCDGSPGTSYLTVGQTNVNIGCVQEGSASGGAQFSYGADCND
jgi:hypothetical protein